MVYFDYWLHSNYVLPSCLKVCLGRTLFAVTLLWFFMIYMYMYDRSMPVQTSTGTE